VPHTNWTLKYVDSEELVGEGGSPATNAFDTNNNTFWHTQWYSANPPPPHEIQINLGATYNLNGFRYLPPQSQVNGRISQYEFYVSQDGVSWGTAVATGTFANNASEKQTLFSSKTGQYVRLRALTEVNGQAWSAMAELNVLQAGGGPDPKSIEGAWSSIISLPIVAIDMSLLRNGRSLIWQDDNQDDPRGSGANTVAYVWDVATNSLTSVNNPTTDFFCSGHAFLPNGQLFVAGGHDQTDYNGARTAFMFDSSSNTWSQGSSLMANGRWYPTVTALANGEMLVVSGTMTSPSGVNPIPEVWQTNNGGGWRQLGSASLSLPLYPWMHLAPNGKVFNSGSSATTRYLDTSGSGAWSAVANHVYTAEREFGSSVMYDPGKIIVMGGGWTPTNTAEIIDLNVPNPSWQSVSSMAFARRHMNATLLPDGKVLVTGGSSSPDNDATLAVYTAEMWDPATRIFRPMAAMQVPRMYHSTTVLLADGRVLSAGGGRPAATGTTDQRNADIYSPPYLFQANGSAAVRPVITSVSATNVTYGQQFTVSTPSAATITAVNWIRLSSTTHTFNESQSINHLGFTQAAGQLSVTVPSSPAVCPPGYYMLFILKNGVPSISNLMHIQ
jgi:hypothetical protein